MDEVMDPSLVIYGEGLFSGLILYILNKIKYTNNLNIGKKITLINYLAQSRIINFNTELRIIKHTNFIINSPRHFHTKVRASKRIGPHNSDILSVIVGSLLGDCYANRRSIEGTRFVYKQSILHKDYLF
jgi:hypothetical protein